MTVTNFPTQQPEPSWKEISVVENLNITWNTSSGGAQSEPVYFFAPIGGYGRMVVYARVMNMTDVGGVFPSEENNVDLQVSWYWIYDYGEVWGATGYGAVHLKWKTGYDISVPITEHSGNTPIPTAGSMAK